MYIYYSGGNFNNSREYFADEMPLHRLASYLFTGTHDSIHSGHELDEYFMCSPG